MQQIFIYFPAINGYNKELLMKYSFCPHIAFGQGGFFYHSNKMKREQIRVPSLHFIRIFSAQSSLLLPHLLFLTFSRSQLPAFHKVKSDLMLLFSHTVSCHSLGTHCVDCEAHVCIICLLFITKDGDMTLEEFMDGKLKYLVCIPESRSHGKPSDSATHGPTGR